LRRSFSRGLSFDFNIRFHTPLAVRPGAEGTAGIDGTAIQNIFNPAQFRGSSDFDIRHLVNANVVYELPLGKNKPFLSGVASWVDQIIGGWQVSSIMRFASGLPTVI
jgi:hypothetical protein